ncbi:hypothetical protein [Sphingobium sp. WCS2017Hpa-17]|uniref:hypothetical protein n=1 Tax=Sphingobium sp. WCS2017Hpa-17 TaxID=3073638 RepID=UPI00288A02F2|nr:hypothetical protein [Sphingobium sp. WCS2017Hpa-17]
MSRKQKIVTIEAEGRDRGKSFLILEKSAWDQERWAMRLLLALGKAGVDIPDDALTAGVVGIMAAGITSLSRLTPDDAEPLMDEMMGCVSIIPDLSRRDPANTEMPITRSILRGGSQGEGDIEEFATLLRLRAEVAELHVGFSVPAALSTLAAHHLTSNRQNSSTSRRSAGRSSRAVKPRSKNSKATTG